MTTVTLASLFDGIGGAPLCAIRCGAVPVWASEIEKFPIKVTEHHFPSMKHIGDITKINGSEADPVDIIVGGSPCQDLSVAGKRAGLAGGRSGLFMEQVRIIKQMREKHGADKPRFMVWENVPGAFSSNSGEDFRAVLEETARIADPTVCIPRPAEGWSNAGSVLGDGWSVSWRTIDAQYFGVPQRRRRIYLVADFGGKSAPEILFERDSMPGNPAASGAAREGTSGEVEEGIGDADRSMIAALRGRQGGADIEFRSDGIANAIESSSHNSRLIFEEGPGGAECFGGEIAFALRSRHDSSPCVDNGMNIVFTCKDFGADASCEISPTLRAMGHLESHPNGGGQLAVAFSHTQDPNAVEGCAPCMGHDGLALYEWHNQDSRITGPIDNAGTLNTNADGREGHLVHDHVRTFVMQAIGEHKESDAASSAKMRDYKDATDLVVGPTVRRLTPLECERLQGYPDGWTDIPGASDSNRYKALGNSFAIPCAYFVVSGCVEQIRKETEKA